MRTLTLSMSLLGLVIATAGLRADTHTHLPNVFYSTFSGTHVPVLRIKRGDRVMTTTLDDVGAGADGKIVVQGPNPQTGPFYVEGAEPGDLLVVTLDKLTPNRKTGYSTSVMAPGSIDPGSITSKPDAMRFPWTIDTATGVVRLDLHAVSASTDWRSRFTAPAFEMTLRPSLGSIGVAPPSAEAIRTTMSGPFGGNVLSSGLTAGAAVMLPVFQTGALLFIGHGHARQGDGGVTGTGIETSMDVEFSVEVVKKKEWPHSSVARPSTVVGEFAQGWPRVETDDYLMTIGSAASLQEALQHATIELHHWLDDDFGLSEKTVSIFVGQAMEYEIASVSEPTVTVVAKVRKSYLPRPAP
jgi:amidase